jgi:hypothetical protein
MKRTILFCCIAGVALFILTFIFNGFIYEYFLSFFDTGLPRFQLTGIGSFNILLCVAIALIPVFILLTWLLGSIDSLIKRLLSIWLVGICISAAVTANVFRILSKQMAITNLKAVMVYPFNELYLEYAILAGTLIGCGISFLVFKSKQTA